MMFCTNGGYISGMSEKKFQLDPMTHR